MKKLLTLLLAVLFTAPMLAQSKVSYSQLIGVWQTDWQVNNDDENISKTAKISLNFIANKEGGILLDITGAGEKGGQNISLKAQVTLDCMWIESGDTLRSEVKANTAKFKLLEMNVGGTNTLPLIGEEGVKQINDAMMQQMIQAGLIEELSSKLYLSNLNLTSPTTLTCTLHDDELTFTRK